MKKLIIGLALGTILLAGVAFTAYAASDGWTDTERESYHQACVNYIDPDGRWQEYGFGQRLIDRICDHYTSNMETCFTPGAFSSMCLIK